MNYLDKRCANSLTGFAHPTLAEYAEDPTLMKNIVAEGCEKARKLARETMREVRDVMGLNYG